MIAEAIRVSLPFWQWIGLMGGFLVLGVLIGLVVRK